MRSFSGCWTCRLRRKKCDEQHPVCNGCVALNITCYYDLEKPEWMDGGPKQVRTALVRLHTRYEAVMPLSHRCIRFSEGLYT